MLTDKPLPGHQYSASLMLAFIALLLNGPVSQRAAATVLELMGTWLNWDRRLPVANTGRLWLARLGLYALNCVKPRADDWLWMMDHTVQLGPWKCLVVVGIRISDWQALDRPLCHQDLSLLNLTPMKSATKEAVAEQLELTSQKMGPPAAVLSDEGAELISGMRLFQRQFAPEICPPHVHDIKHKAATLLKKEVATDSTWDDYVSKMTRTRVQVVLTSLAFLVPPRLQTKARFMSLDCVVQWGQRVLRLLRQPGDFSTPLDRKKLQAKFGWLLQFEEPLNQWQELLAVIHTTEDCVRRCGYHAGARAQLAPRLEPLVTCPSAERVSAGLLDFIEQQSQRVRPNLIIPGCTEVLESLLGKYKYHQGRYSQGGMTMSLLNIGAIVIQKTPELIAEALATTPVQSLSNWVRDNLGPTLASQRMQTFRAPPPEQNPHQIRLAAGSPF